MDNRQHTCMLRLHGECCGASTIPTVGKAGMPVTVGPFQYMLKCIKPLST